MDWIRSSMEILSSHEPHREPHREPDVDVDGTPKFRIVDSSNRVRELTAPSASASSASSSSSYAIPPLSAGASSSSSSSSASASSSFMMVPSLSRPVSMSASHHFNHHSSNRSLHQDGDGDDDMLDDDAQLAQQLQFQREEMQFTRTQPLVHNPSPHQGLSLPRIQPPPPPSHPFQSQSSLQNNFSNHAFTYSDSSSTATLHHQLHPLKAPPTVPPVSPFAGLALSAPVKSSMGNAKPPVNPFSTASPSPNQSLATSIESSPRLPSLNAFRAGSPRNLKMGIASRPSSLSLRGSSGLPESSSASPSPHLGPLPTPLNASSLSTPLPSLSSSLPSPHHSLSSPYSHSLPGLSYLQDRLTRHQSFDGSDSVTNASYSSEDDEREPALLMMRLSSSVPAGGALDMEMAMGANGSRSGRVCRFTDCNNIARSRGLCRTHGGGKRCSHPGCDKSAQANRKCIAHGGGTPCSFEDCEKTAQSRGLCKAHGGGARCKHPNCPKSSQSKGLCRGHGGGIKCKEDGCDKWVQKNGYCIKHGRERAMTQ